MATSSTPSASDPLALTTPSGAQHDNPITGDYRVDALIEDAASRWNAGSPMGTPAMVTYSFMAAAPLYGGTDFGYNHGFSAFTAAQKAAVRSIVARLEAEFGLRLVEVPDTSTSYGQIRFGNNVQDTSLGYAWLPGSGDERSGDVWIDASTRANLTPTQGSDAWATLVHEIGHALGLKHPGVYADSDANGNALGAAEDRTDFTIMSYNDPFGLQPREWFGMYDMLALGTLYGRDAVAIGDTTHAYTDATGRVLALLADSGGTDTLDLSALTLGSTVDLRPGGFSSVGWNHHPFFGTRPAAANLSIDLGTVIENYMGTGQADYVTGNDADNHLVLGAGANRADGGAGIDEVLYAGARAGYQVDRAGGTITVQGGGASDVLENVERLVFADGGLAFDLAGDAGITARIIGAVFGPQEVANRGYVSIGLQLLEDGMSYETLMQFALDARLGAGASDAQVVDLLYTNVVGTPPPPAEAAVYEGLLRDGWFTHASLGVFAAEHELNAGRIGLVGLADDGLAFA